MIEIKNYKPSTIRYVYFDKDTGSVLHIVKSLKHDESNPYIEVDVSEVRPVIEHKISVSDLKIEFDPKEKQYKFKKTKLATEVYDVNESIYKFSNSRIADIILIQDIPNTCWKVEIDKILRTNLIKTQVGLDVLLTFSITVKDNPNILLKLLKISLRDLVNNGYSILPFTQEFENLGTKVSIYTSRKFNTYSHKVLK